MTTSRFNQQYVKSTETEYPKIRVQTRFPFLSMLKLLFLGEYAHVYHELSADEIEELSRSIIKWRVVTNLRKHKEHATTK